VLAQALMEAEASARTGAEYGQRTPGRLTHRNGYRPRAWDIRVGTIELAIPRLCQGSYLPSWLEPRRRAERALCAVVVAQCYVEGVSTRRVDDIARQMGIGQISKSQVSRICAELDELVAAWRNRPLDQARTRLCGSMRWACGCGRRGGSARRRCWSPPASTAVPPPR
jgi:transposase-like protein